MREIEFRGKDLDLNWIYGNLIQNEDICLIAPKVLTLDYCGECDRPFELVYEVINKTLGQYTGLKDKNGKKIFEGDIVKDILGQVGQIVYKEKYSAFVVDKWECGYALWFDKGIEVIGNIYDNKDLIGE